jgi:glutamate/tyrosine decarboxylase-like PLP-dependent enzyme
LNYLVKGVDLADSWSVDAHKTLNAPFDNGIILAAAGGLKPSTPYDRLLYYLQQPAGRDALHPGYVPPGQGVELWATLNPSAKEA